MSRDREGAVTTTLVSSQEKKRQTAPARPRLVQTEGFSYTFLRFMQPSKPSQPDALTTTIRGRGARLDRAVADWRGLSRAAVLRLLDQGALRCNGRVMARSQKGDLLRAGDRLSLAGPYEQGEAPLPDPGLALDVLVRGEGYLVVNKPAGVPVRPHALDESGTVLNAAAAMCPELIGVGEGGLRSGVVHRLDTDTSGALLLATSQVGWDRFREAFSGRRIQKRYAALVQGVPTDAGQSKRALRVATHRPARVEVKPLGQGGDDARVCSLGWRVVERFGTQASLVEVDLHTGFLHQVRVMMNDLGHPVIGDTVYGDAKGFNAPRQMLHAGSLAFEELAAEAPLPGDMLRLIEALRG